MSETREMMCVMCFAMADEPCRLAAEPDRCIRKAFVPDPVVLARIALLTAKLKAHDSEAPDDRPDMLAGPTAPLEDQASRYRVDIRSGLPAIHWSLPLVLEEFPARDTLPTTTTEDC